MVEITYGGTFTDDVIARSQSTGGIPGPPAGDGWQIAARLPSAQLPQSTTQQLALIVRGRIGSLTRTGSQPLRGLAQVCLGRASGTKSEHHVCSISLRSEEVPCAGALDGVAFVFMLVVGSGITDPTFGATIDTTSGDDLCLWMRTAWNGDALNYASTCELSDVQWLWFDLDAIPSGDQLVEDFRPSTPVVLGTSTTDLHLNTNTPGSAGEKWMHFVRVVYQPRAIGADAPSFEFGYSNTSGSFAGFVPMLGTDGKCGQSRAAEFFGPVPVTLSLGGMWYQQQPAGVFLPAARATDRFNGAPTSTETRVVRYTYLGIRLDNLPDVLTRRDAQLDGVAVSLNHPTVPWDSRPVTLERPATGFVAAPTAFVCGIVSMAPVLPTIESFGIAFGNEHEVQTFPTGFSVAEGTRMEGVPLLAWRGLRLGPSIADLQIRAHFVGGLSNIDGVRNVRDVSMVTAYLIRDPENLPAVPPTEVSRVEIVPGREGPSLASLSFPPIAPDAEIEEQAIAIDRPAIEGATGYKRSWPSFVQPRRQLRLTWTLSNDDAETIDAFLVANRIFKFTLPSDSPAAWMQVEPFEVAAADVFAGTISVRVVELVWLD